MNNILLLQEGPQGVHGDPSRPMDFLQQHRYRGSLYGPRGFFSLKTFIAFNSGTLKMKQLV